MSHAIPIRFDVLHAYADRHGLDYNDLCRTVLDAIADGPVTQPVQAHGLNGSPSSYLARPSDPDLNPVSVKDLSASASPATKEQQ